tara:strand:+ start:283 stop:474 length:192 start_codon:yes stop_codon:yes gene_type:complete
VVAVEMVDQVGQVVVEELEVVLLVNLQQTQLLQQVMVQQIVEQELVEEELILQVEHQVMVVLE